ncbi:MAG: sugar transferase [Clostridium sp.]
MRLKIKRAFDIVFAICCSVFAIPIVLITMIIIRINSPEDPTMFKQTRIGYKGKKFIVYKLRTMTNEKDENGDLLLDEERLKTWGKVIRKLSIDELTQIFNILCGQMSWIGPRPLLPKEMSVMTKTEQIERQSYLPGITGWEAVNESKSDSRRTMAEYDLYYVRNWSLRLDLKIFIKTVGILFSANRTDEEHRAPKLKDDEIISKH